MRLAFPVFASLLTGSFFIDPQYVCAADPVIAFGFAELAAGDDFSAYLEANGSLYAVGSNQHGQLGDGTNITRSEFSYVTSGVSSLACGANHLMFVKTDGSLWAMGYNSSGQLGDGSNESSLLPKQIVTSGVTAVAAGGDHSLFVKTDGSLWAMGANITGQLGDGNMTDRNIPVQVVDSGVASVSAGGNHSLYAKTDGSLWAMGSGWAGALGTGFDDGNATPLQVVDSNVTLVSAGGNHSLFVKTGGSLWGMGFNSSGQLGDSSTTDRLSPVQILSSDVVSVATGDNHSLVLKTDGSLWAMGNNAHGQLGDGSQINRVTPVQVEISGTVVLAAGNKHSLYATSADNLKSMGRNAKAALGDGSTQDQAIPVTVRDGTMTITMSEDGLPTAWSAPSLVATDEDASDVLTWSLAESPLRGTVVLSGTGASPTNFTYTPDGNFSGSDSFVAQVSDGTSVDTVNVNVNVEAVNDAPVFVQGSSVSVTMSEGGVPVAWNAPILTVADAEGDTLNWFAPTEPSNGTSFFEVNGSTVTLNYTPDAEFNGADVFEVSVTDGVESALLTVNVNVTTVNDPPVIAQGEKVSDLLIEGETLATPNAPTLSASDPDGDSLTWSLVTSPANGLATVNGTGASPTTFTYTPPENFFGEDSFVVMVSDGDMNDTILVILDVSGVNDMPVIAQGSSVSVTMSEDGSPIPWAAPELNATDPDGDTLTWSLLASPVNGSATVSGSGESPSTFNFTPTEDFNGTDSFVVRVSDGSVSIDVTVNVTVESVNEAPVIAQGDSVSATMSEDGSPSAWSAPVLTVTDTDSDDDVLTWSVGTVPPSGSVIVSGTGTSPTVFNYEPSPDFFGGESFVVQVSDGNATDFITVEVTVSPVNDAPLVAQGSSLLVTMSEDESPIPWIAPTLTASDADGDDLAWSLSIFPSNGTASVGGTDSTPSTFTYFPNPGFVGSDSFAALVSDGNSSVPVTINVTVEPVNDPPSIHRGVTRVAAGEGFSFYLDANGSLYAAGVNDRGQLGDGSGDNRFSFVQIATGVNEVDAGGAHALFVKTDGSLWTMGDNTYGQLGDASTTNRLDPVQIVSSGVSSVSSGKNHSLFVKTDGSLWAMGENAYGQLGDNSTTNRLTPVQIISSGVSTASAGVNHSLVVKTDNSLWAMGSNESGAFGDETTIDSILPKQVLLDVITASAGNSYSLFVKTNGSFYTVGSNAYGQLGDGETTDRPTLLQILVSGVSSAAAGLNGTSFFLKANGSLWAMGNNQYGQLGDGSTTHRPSPVQIESTGVFLASPGGSHALYANRDGSIRGMGLNDKGALGDGSTTNYLTSIEIDDGALEITMSEDGSPTAWLAPLLTASDTDGDILAWSVVTAPSNGSVLVSGTGTSPTAFTYQPNANFNGSDSFVARVSDGTSSIPVMVKVVVVPVPDSPTITQGSSIAATMSEDGSPLAWVSPLLTATDPDGDSLNWRVNVNPENGSASVNGIGAVPEIFQYIPDVDFAGIDTFVVEVSDGNLTDVITVNVTVLEVNDPPVLSANFSLSVIMSEDGVPTPWNAPALTASDPDAGDLLTWSVSSVPTKGTADVSGSGTNPSVFSYVPNLNYVGADSFMVKVSDGNSSDEVGVNLTILAVSDAPFIDQGNSILVTMSEDGSPSAWPGPNLTATDPDAGELLTWSLLTPPTHGLATVGGTGSSPSTLVFSPLANWSGTESFVVKLDDGTASDTITVNVTIEPVNDIPVIGQGTSVTVTMSEDSSPVSWVRPTLTASDLEEDSLTWSLSSGPSHGSASVIGTGAVPTELSYEPTADFTGSDSFDVRVSDGNASATITVSVIVESVNDSPVITQGESLFATMSEDSVPTAWSTPTLTALDPDSTDVLVWRLKTVPLHGSVEVNGTGTSPATLTYFPNSNWSGDDTFVVEVSDGNTSDSLTFNIVVEPVNDVPVIAQGSTVSVAMSEDSSPVAWSSPVLTASDADGELLAWSLSGNASHGVVAVSGTGSGPTVFTYEPMTDFAGLDSFAIQVSDGNSSAEISVNVNVGGVNDAPVIDQGTVISVAMSEDGSPSPWNPPSLSASDREGHVLAWNLSGEPSHGIASVSGIGTSPTTFFYEPSANYAGMDAFRVAVSDGNLSDEITVNVTVIGVNDAPVIFQGSTLSVMMSEDGVPTAWSSPTLTVLDFDVSDALTWSVSAAPSHGSVDANGTGTSPDVLVYNPDVNWSGTDSFSVQVSDGNLSDEILIVVSVGAINDPPLILQGSVVSVNMSEDGSPVPWNSPFLSALDREGEVLVWSLSGGPQHGEVLVGGTGASPTTFTYEPSADYEGEDSFVVQVSDGNATDEITVKVNIGMVNDAPVINQGAAVTFAISEDTEPGAWNPPTLSASDAEGDVLVWSVSSQPSHGLVSASGTGSTPTDFTYQPVADYAGTDTFRIQVSDGNASSEITVTVVVEGVNDAPVITQGSVFTVMMSEDGVPTAWSPPALTALDNDANDILTWSVSATPSHGSVEVNGTGASPAALVYYPDTNWSGTDSFRVRVDDGIVSDEITIQVNVVAVNDEPIIGQSSGVTVIMSEDGSPIAWSAPTISAADSDGEELVWSLSRQPLHGTASVGGTGASPEYLLYQPTADFVGMDSFVIRVSDGNASSEVAVDVIIKGVNDAPVIAGSSLLTSSMSEDGVPVRWIPPKLIATDVDGDDLTWDLLFLPSHGMATIHGVGESPSTFSYSPAPNFSGTDTFVVKVSDGLYSDAVTVKVSVASVNDPPVIAEGPTVNVTMSVNGTLLAWTAPKVSVVDIEEDPLTWTLLRNPVHGTATVQGFGVSPSLVNYVPETNFLGNDTFDIQVTDGSSTDSITVKVDIIALNDTPVIRQGSSVSVTLSEDGHPSAWSAPELSAYDLQGDELSWSLSKSPSHGKAVVSGTGASPSDFTYEPVADYAGADSFVVRVSDGKANADILVNVTVENVNDAPVISQGSSVAVTLSEDGHTIPWTAPVILAEDKEGSELSWRISTQPSHGTVAISGMGASPSTFSYQPTTDYAGGDSFTVQVSDGEATAEIVVEVTVESVNDAPIITQGSSVSVTLSEDSHPVPWSAPELSAVDVDGDELSWSLSRQPSHGAASVSGIGTSPSSFIYQPPSEYAGKDSFAVEVSDGNATTEIVVNVTIEDINDVPVIIQGSSVAVTLSEDAHPTSWSAPALTAVDVDGDELRWSLSKQSLHGTASVSGTGKTPAVFTYQPAADYFGADSFVIQVSDGETTAEIVVKVTVESVNDAPVITQGSSVSVTLSEDSNPVPWSAPELSAVDVDGDELSWSLSKQPSHGAVSMVGIGASPSTFSYQPTMDYFGADSFAVQVSDGNATAVTLVSVIVEPVNDPPSSLEFRQSGFLYENFPAGTAAGTFSTSDVDDDSNHTYALVSEANESIQNHLFSLDANGTLKTVIPLDFETNPMPKVKVRVSDVSGDSREETFAILLTDVFLPGVNTFTPTDILHASATLNGAVEDSGDDPAGVSGRGFVLGRNPDPDLDDNDTSTVSFSAGSGDGNFFVNTESLVPGRVYYCRAYATNSEGTRYGPQRRFVTVEKRSLGPWVNAVNTAGNWWRSEWFGDFYTTDTDWIYHGDFGWLFVYGYDPANLWIWQENLGWLWISEAAFPCFYSSKSSNWLLWKENIGDTSVFFDYSQARWVRHSLLALPSTSASYE